MRIVPPRQADDAADRHQMAAEREARAGEYAAVLARVLELRGGISATRGQIGSLRARLAQQPKELMEASFRDNPRVAKLKEKLDALAV